MSKWDKSDFISAWETQAESLRSAVSDADLSRPVPSCPDWTLEDLVRHVANVNHTTIVRLQSTEPPAGNPVTELEGQPLDLLDQTRAQVLDVFNSLSIDDPAWNFAPQPKTARFWFRRLACETAIHRWDAQMAMGQSEPIDVPLAVAGIEEVLDSLLPWRWQRPETADVAGLAQLAAHDADRMWFVRMNGHSLAVLDIDSMDSEEQPQARIAGSASDLLLALWGRIPFGIVDAKGDEELLKLLKAS
jgi:uncharacterized protein (TIGR03083 family)